MIYNKINIDELSISVHNNSASHGFWDIDLSDEHVISMIIGELAEAIEADRKKEKTSPVSLDEYIEVWKPVLAQSGSVRTNEGMFSSWYSNNIKGSIGEEFADAIIRGFDLAGKRGWVLSRLVIEMTDSSVESTINKSINGKSFTEIMYQLFKILTSEREDSYYRISAMITYLYFVAKHLEIDIEQHIEWKMRYNSSRPFMHGKLY